MFGHQDKDKHDHHDGDSTPMQNVMSDDAAAQAAATPADDQQQPVGVFDPAAAPAPAADDTATPEVPAPEQPAQEAEPTPEVPQTPEDPGQIDVPVPVVGNEAYSNMDGTSQPAPAPSSDFGGAAPSYGFGATPEPATPEETAAPEVPASPEVTTSSDATPVADDGLLALKQQALGELSPLVDHLEQSPEEKFRTTMMMIQASDNQSLIKVAYEAAQAIPDEKVKAQALLDIVNEINYFTHQGHQQ